MDEECRFAERRRIIKRIHNATTMDHYKYWQGELDDYDREQRKRAVKIYQNTITNSVGLLR